MGLCGRPVEMIMVGKMNFTGEAFQIFAGDCWANHIVSTLVAWSFASGIGGLPDKFGNLCWF
jgi:hypothetical protein